jgi:chitodextrinase
MHIVYEEEGVALSTPAIVQPTQGSVRTLNAPAVEQWRSFDRWSDGVTALSRSFAVGTSPLSFSAQYVNRPPLASAGATRTGRLSVGFDSVGSGDPEGGALSYAWSFGDGANGSGPAPSHAYPAPGVYVATLTVTDPIGGTGSDTASITIPNGAPTAAFTVTPYGGPAPIAITFDARSSSDPDGDALAYAWNFGDGANGSGAVVSHTYTTRGNFVATLGVSDPYLATGASQAYVMIAPPRSSACGLGPELAVAVSALLALRRALARR